MKNTILILLLCPLLSTSQINKYIRQALRLQDPQQQIELLDQALAIDAKHLDALFYRAIAKYNLEDYDAAILDFTKIIFYEPDADSYYNRGNCKFNLQDYNGALLDYKSALELDPDLIGTYFNLGNAKFYLGDYKAAVIDFNKVIRSFPSDYKSYSQRARAHMKLKNYKLAFKDFNACILLRPNSKSYYNRGYALLEIDYYDKAKADFIEALAINSNNTPAYFYLGVSEFLLNNYEASVKYLTVATNKDPQDYDAYLGLAMSYYNLKTFKKAKIAFEKSKRLLDSKSNSSAIFKNTYWDVNEQQLFKTMFKNLNQL